MMSKFAMRRKLTAAFTLSKKKKVRFNQKGSLYVYRVREAWLQGESEILQGEKLYHSLHTALSAKTPVCVTEAELDSWFM